MTGARYGCRLPAGNMRGQRAQHPRQSAFGVAAADEQRRGLERFRFEPFVGPAIFADLPDQGVSVVTELLFWCGRQSCPGAVALNHIEESFQSALNIVRPDFLG